MKSKMILTIGLLAIVVGIATTGIAIKSVQAVTPDPEAIKKAAKQATANSLRLASQQLTSNPSLSQLAINHISDNLGFAANQLDPAGGVGGGGGSPNGGCCPDPGCVPPQCVNENDP